MSRNSSDINFSDVRIAAQNLNHMLQHQDLEARHSPDPSRSDHIETAEEADQIFRDEILAQHLKKRHSDLGGDIRPPRYSQVVDQTSRFTRDEEMLERPSSRGGQPPRYSQVFGRGQRDARGEEALARQIRDGSSRPKSYSTPPPTEPGGQVGQTDARPIQLQPGSRAVIFKEQEAVQVHPNRRRTVEEGKD
ncbi:hypothetical protein PRZ48_012568 [Zasmidium cellare]|uniref:Uncharacterized protein n=1 Tax=Zasmidium cellare TaxID=395010 RepID=A0ABR0E666_ZASCE|nr:hypothetical protein PRZ48_012568 [Zasmidium cellare]